MTGERRTVLYDQHVALGAKMVAFAGWEMPVQYGAGQYGASQHGTGVIAEHIATRTAAGLFDVSHMGELWVTGPQALALLQELTCNDVSKIADGRAQYNAIINPNGGVVDDIIVYRFSSERFLVCVNASNADKDFEWFVKHNRKEAVVTNASAEYGQIALQGPRATSILSKVSTSVPEKAFAFTTASLLGAECIIARTGYTGEDGVEIFCPTAATPALWNKLLEVGSPEGLVPCGLGARDSLRLEACLPLHGHELGEEISAIESGLGWIVKLAKGDFTGKAVLEAHSGGASQAASKAAPRKLVGFYVIDPGIARHGDPVVDSSGERIGVVTSGTKTPTVGRALGLALVSSQHSALGSRFFVEVRGRRLAAEIVPTPFYRRAK